MSNEENDWLNNVMQRSNANSKGVVGGVTVVVRGRETLAGGKSEVSTQWTPANNKQRGWDRWQGSVLLYPSEEEKTFEEKNYKAGRKESALREASRLFSEASRRRGKEARLTTKKAELLLQEGPEREEDSEGTPYAVPLAGKEVVASVYPVATGPVRRLIGEPEKKDRSGRAFQFISATEIETYSRKRKKEHKQKCSLTWRTLPRDKEGGIHPREKGLMPVAGLKKVLLNINRQGIGTEGNRAKEAGIERPRGGRVEESLAHFLLNDRTTSETFISND